MNNQRRDSLSATGLGRYDTTVKFRPVVGILQRDADNR